VRGCSWTTRPLGRCVQIEPGVAAMSNSEKAVYAALAAAAAYLVFAWSTASPGYLIWEMLRFAIVISGVGLALWNLVRDADETLTEPGSRSRRLRWLLLGLAAAGAAALSPLPFGSPRGISWHNLCSTITTAFPSPSASTQLPALAGARPSQQQ
jgi:hypothetical protein